MRIHTSDGTRVCRMAVWPWLGRSLAGVFLCVVALAAVNAPGLAQEPSSATTVKKPSILIIDVYRGRREYWNPLVLQEMLDAGYEVGMCPRGKTPTAEELKRYNVALVVSTAVEGAADFSADLQPKLEKFMEQGGGVAVTPVTEYLYGGYRSELLFQWLKELGATVYLHGVVDPERRRLADWCAQPGVPEYAWTSEIGDSPITRGVKTLWYRTGVSAASELCSAPMDLDANWTPLVFTGPGSRTVSWAESPHERDALSSDYRKDFAAFLQPQGRAQGRLPLVAVRNRGAGRLAVLSMNPQDLFWSAYIPARAGVVLRRGFDDRPSDGWKLLDNLYRWLAEPSLAGTALGGAKTARDQLFRAPVTAQKPYDWRHDADAGIEASALAGKDSLRVDAVKIADKLAAGAGCAPRGLAGAHSAYTSGKGSVAEWVTAAKDAGLDFLIFMEDLSQMNAEKWEKLKAECAAHSGDEFLAYPGMEFEHENFNRGYLFNRHWRWFVEGKILTKDNRFIQTSRNVPGGESGALWLWLAHNQTALTCIMTVGFFAHQTNLTPAWAHRGFGSMAVFTRDRERIIDDFADTLPVFLRLQNQKLVISPMALSLMSDPAEIAGVVKRGGPFVTLLSDKKNAASAIDNGGTYCYGGRSSALCASTGPKILAWTSVGNNPSYVFPRWNVAKREEDFFVLDNYRYRVRLAVESAAGLKEILIYNGDQGVYRRFRPEGKHRYETTLDLSNDQSRHLVLVVKDLAGGIAVSPEIQTEHWANRHYLCADRCNFGSGNMGQGAYYVHPGPYTTQQGPETMLMARWERPVISADLTALRVNLDTRFETAGAYGYVFGNPWHCYYRTWPAEEMKIAKTDYYWAGRFGGPIYNLEEYFPAALDSIWGFPMPKEPFYPENRWTPDPRTLGLPDWKLTGHSVSEVVLTADVTFREPWVSALHETKDYVPGQDAYDFRIGGRRWTGTLTGTNAPPLDQNGEAPEGGLFALTSGAGKTNACWFVNGAGLSYKLHAANGKVTLDVGWPVVDAKAKKGTTYRWEVYGLNGAPTDVALNELLQPSGLKASVGVQVTNRFPYTYTAADGAVHLKATDLRPIPCEWIPLEVRGLHTRRTAYWHEIGADRIRPIGIDPDGVGRAVLWRNKHDAEFFIGHPVCCSDPEIWFDAVRLADSTWILDVNNPTERERTATFFWQPAWPGRGELPKDVKLPPGGRSRFALKEVAQ